MMANFKKTRQVLAENRLAPKKRFGQNFLVRSETAQAMVAASGVKQDDVVVEVGVGLAALTRPLAKAAGQVIGFEIDRGIVQYHKQNNELPANVTLVHADFLKADFTELAARCNGPLKIMANLPYSITNPFLFKLIDNRRQMAWAMVMLQKEVAMRLTAEPGTKNYGVPTVLMQSCAKVRPLMTLKPCEFHPRPKIDSMVVRIDFSSDSNRPGGLPAYDYAIFSKIVRQAFSQRRKILLNTLGSLDLFFQPHAKKKQTTGKKTAGRILAAARIPPEIRAEKLRLEDFIRLTTAVEQEIAAMNQPDEFRFSSQ